MNIWFLCNYIKVFRMEYLSYADNLSTSYHASQYDQASVIIKQRDERPERVKRPEKEREKQREKESN